jgi:hypothetical protein
MANSSFILAIFFIVEKFGDKVIIFGFYIAKYIYRSFSMGDTPNDDRRHAMQHFIIFWPVALC